MCNLSSDIGFIANGSMILLSDSHINNCYYILMNIVKRYIRFNVVKNY